jgi:Na+/citrate or Na+/malate symporter
VEVKSELAAETTILALHDLPLAEGETGDTDGMSYANRMNLMPFSQMVTRLGGAGMVVLATLLMHHFG